MTTEQKKLFSVVVPVYYNAESLPALHARLAGLSERIHDYHFEFVFVDDGSGDDSLAVLKRLQKQDPRIRIVKLTRNFTSIFAVLAGYAKAKGDIIGLVTADLQDPPEVFEKMLPHIREGKKLVLAVRASRSDENLFSSLFYLLMRNFALPNYPQGGFDMTLATREVINEVLKMHEKNSNTQSLLFWLGYEFVAVPYHREERLHGKSRWTFWKKFKLTIDSLVAFSYFPIRAMSFTGAVTAFVGFAYGVFTFANALLGKVPVAGWASLVCVLTFFSGTIMLMLGVIGEYLWRVLDEVRQRPPYVIDEIF